MVEIGEGRFLQFVPVEISSLPSCLRRLPLRSRVPLIDKKYVIIDKISNRVATRKAGTCPLLNVHSLQMKNILLVAVLHRIRFRGSHRVQPILGLVQSEMLRGQNAYN